MKGITKSKGIGIAAITALLAALLIAAAITPAMAGGEGTPSTLIDGGYVIVNETGGSATITSVAYGFSGSYVPGRTYKIEINYTYVDAPDVWSNIVHFRVTGPDGSIDYKSIYDHPIFNDSDEGTRSVLWSPSGPGKYEYMIGCGAGGESIIDVADINLT